MNPNPPPKTDKAPPPPPPPLRTEKLEKDGK